MRKKGCLRAIIIAIIAIIIIVLIVTFLKQLLVKFDKESQTEVTSVEGFQGRNSLLDAENADYHSQLLIMPENVTQDMKIDKYYFREYQSLNNLYTILLVYTLEDEAYKKEKERLSELKLTYKEEDKYILHIEEGANNNCYLTIYDEYGNYEYVLTDDTQNKIVCVFTQYDGFEKIPKEYQLQSFVLSKDLWESEEIAFNMYCFWEGKGIRTMPE